MSDAPESPPPVVDIPALEEEVKQRCTTRALKNSAMFGVGGAVAAAALVRRAPGSRFTKVAVVALASMVGLVGGVVYTTPSCVENALTTLPTQSPLRRELAGLVLEWNPGLAEQLERGKGAGRPSPQ